jgi:hypothetical protein
MGAERGLARLVTSHSNEGITGVACDWGIHDSIEVLRSWHPIEGMATGLGLNLAAYCGKRVLD